MEFAKHLGLFIEHEYFSEGFGLGLTIKPGDECVKQLRNYNMLVKSSANGLTIFNSNDSGLGKPSADIVFDFLLYTNDAQFYQYTALGDKKNDEVYLFSNQTSNKKSTVKLVESVISAQEIKPDLDHSLIGVIRLRLDNKLPIKLTLSFSARSIKWKYYVLSNASRTNMVVDGKLSDITFARKDGAKKAPDAIITALTDNYPTASISFFESEKTVALNSRGRKNIQLKNELSNTVIIKHLPNPALQNNGIQIINLLD